MVWHVAKLGPTQMGSVSETSPQFNNGFKFIASPEASSRIIDGQYTETLTAKHFSKYSKCFNDLEEAKAFVISHFPPEVYPFITWHECKLKIGD